MKKKTIIMGSIAVGLGIIIIIAGLIYQLPSAQGITSNDIPSFPHIVGLSGQYTLAISYPVMNDSYPIYKTIPPDATNDNIKHIGTLFDVNGEVEESVPSIGEVQIIDDTKKPTNRLLFYTNSGAYRYDIPDKIYPYATDEQPDLPSDVEAEEIALKYLKERNLLSNDIHLSTVSIGSRSGVSTPDDSRIFNLTKNIAFEKDIEGIPVYNAGITVTIGEKGEIVGVSDTVRQIDAKPFKYVKLITPEDAYQKLTAQDVIIKYLQEDYDKIIVRDISLGYWMDIKTKPQKYVLPIYVFTCENIRGNSKEQVLQYVSAVDPSEIQDIS
jgi:hypothetical protein